MGRLVFVYALDSGLFNEITDYAHKVLRPQTYACNLCALTHHLLGTRRAWKEFLGALPMETEFLYKDVFAERYPQARQEYPSIHVAQGGGVPQILVTSAEIVACRELPALISLVQERLAKWTAAQAPSPAPL